MSENQSNHSLDDILDEIRRDREKKAGLHKEPEPAPEPEKEKSEPENEVYDPLISVYLTAEEIEASRRAVEQAEKKDKGSAEAEKSEDSPSAEQIIEEERERRKKELERRRKRKEDMEFLRTFSENLNDESLLHRERREERRGRRQRTLLDDAEKEGGNLFDAVDSVEKKTKKRGSKFFFAESAAERADRKANNESRLLNAQSIKALRKELLKEQGRHTHTSILTGIIAGMLLFLAIIPEVYNPGGIFEAFLGGMGRIYLGINFALMLLAVAVAFNVLISGVRSFKRLAPNADVCVLIVMVFATFHNLVLLIKGNFVENNAVLYNSVAAFTLLMSNLSKLLSTQRMLNNLKALNGNAELRTLKAVDNRADANQLAHGLSIDKKPILLYSAKTEVPSDFYKLSADTASEEKFFGYALPLAILVGVIVGIIGAVTSGNIFNFITGYTGGLCVCMPVSILFISNLLLTRANIALNKKDCAILGNDRISKIDNSNALIMNTNEVCYASVTNFHCITAYRQMDEMDAVAYCAAIITKGSGVLCDLFKDIVLRQKLSIPPVEDLKYEDRLGYKAWINNECVLIGNREMMTQHNVKIPNMPDLSDVAAGKTVQFMAIEGEVVASFDVQYHLGKYSAKQIKKLTDNGVVLILLTTDCDITEEFIANAAQTSPYSIKVANSRCRDIMNVYMSAGAPKQKCSGMIYKPAVGAQLRAVNAAYNLLFATRQAYLMQLASFVFAAGICLAVNLLGAPSVLNSLVVILYQVVWAVLAYCISSSKIRKP